MKLQMCGAALLSVCGPFAFAQANAKPADPLASIGWLAGGAWNAEVPSPSGGGTTRIQQKPDDNTSALFSAQGTGWKAMFQVKYQRAQ